MFAMAREGQQAPRRAQLIRSWPAPQGHSEFYMLLSMLQDSLARSSIKHLRDELSMSCRLRGQAGEAAHIEAHPPKVVFLPVHRNLQGAEGQHTQTNTMHTTWSGTEKFHLFETRK